MLFAAGCLVFVFNGNSVDTIFDLKIPQSEPIKSYSVSMKFKRG